MLDPITAEIGGAIKPKTILAVGEKRMVKGAAKDPYIQKRRPEGYYSCTCPSWRNVTGSEKERTCPHLRALLGAEYEAARLEDAKSSAPLLNIMTTTKVKKRKHSEDNEGILSNPFVDDAFPHDESGQDIKPGQSQNPYCWNERLNRGPQGRNGGSELLLATKWPQDKDPTGFWLSEKLDGVRAWWDGTRMWARSGRAWNPPDWFKKKLPSDMHLDGELWIRRDAFDMTSGICRRSDTDKWGQINYMVFDITNVSLLYEERLKELRKRLPDGEMSPDEVQNASQGAHICVLPAIKCQGKAHLNALMSQVLDKGGEGLMLRLPRSRYEFKRSKTLYKLKHWYDAEGLVIGHEWGEGEHSRRMGAVQMLMESGKTLTVGSGFSHAMRDAWQPPVGAVIRYRFQELSHDGFPRFPIFEGVVPDKTKPRDAIVRSATFRGGTGLH